MAHLSALNVLKGISRRCELPYFTGSFWTTHRLMPKLKAIAGIKFIHRNEYFSRKQFNSCEVVVYSPIFVQHLSSQFRMYSVQPRDEKSLQSDQCKQEVPSDADEYNKLSAFQKFKAMYRDYWYVLVPVHLSSSIVFLGVFYYAASSGIDIVALLEKLNVSDSIISPLRDSSAGYIAITYALYKIFTPVRYTVTLGGTTWAIKFLTTRGLIKPRPMKEAKQNVQNIITAMKMPENQRQKFLEEKGMPRLGKAVAQASSVSSISSNKDQHIKK